MILQPGCSETFYEIDAAVQSRNIQIKIVGSGWVTVPITTDKDKKVSLDLYEDKSTGEEREGVYCTLRAYTSSYLSSQDFTVPSSSYFSSYSSSSSPPSSFSSPTFSSSYPVSPSVLHPIRSRPALPTQSIPEVRITELTIYSEAVLTNRTGLPLTVRSLRKGSYIERRTYSPFVRYEKGVGGREGQSHSHNQGPRSDGFNFRWNGSGSGLGSSNKESGPMSGSGSGSGSGLGYEEDNTDSVQVPLSQMGLDGKDICLRLLQDSNRYGEGQKNVFRDHSKGSIFTAENSSRKQDITANKDDFQLNNFTVKSGRIYRILTNVQVGDTLYTDRPQLKWSYLPPILR